MIKCYKTGPVERAPENSFHAENQFDDFLKEMGITVIGNSYEHLELIGCPQADYGPALKKLRDQGRFQTYCAVEKLLIYSLRHVGRADFIISKPAPEASGGTVSETVMAWLKGIPKLVIIGPHGEGLLDNDSTFMIRMMTDRYSLVFNTENEVKEFIRSNIKIFKSRRNVIRRFVAQVKKDNPYFNDRLKPYWDEKFEGKTVIIHGISGSGKSTQARLLQDFCGFKFFDSGLELRQLYAKLPALADILRGGELSIEIIVDHLMADKLLNLEKFEPIVFSGTPKKIGEANRLMELLTILDRKPVVVVIDISEELARERIKLRRYCQSCEVSFIHDPKLIDNQICPHCGKPLLIRPENTSEEARERIFAWYKSEVIAVIQYFEDLGLAIHVDGNRNEKEIFYDIMANIF